MKAFALWHGGSSYVPSCAPNDTEEFNSIAEAQRVFEHRASGTDSFYPCVNESEMWLFYSAPTGHDDYPDRIIKQGSRGGTRVEKV